MVLPLHAISSAALPAMPKEAMILTRLALAPLLLALTVLSAAWGYGWPEGVLNWLEDRT